MSLSWICCPKLLLIQQVKRDQRQIWRIQSIGAPHLKCTFRQFADKQLPPAVNGAYSANSRSESNFTRVVNVDRPAAFPCPFLSASASSAAPRTWRLAGGEVLLSSLTARKFHLTSWRVSRRTSRDAATAGPRQRRGRVPAGTTRVRRKYDSGGRDWQMASL